MQLEEYITQPEGQVAFPGDIRSIKEVSIVISGKFHAKVPSPELELFLKKILAHAGIAISESGRPIVLEFIAKPIPYLYKSITGSQLSEMYYSGAHVQGGLLYTFYDSSIWWIPFDSKIIPEKYASPKSSERYSYNAPFKKALFFQSDGLGNSILREFASIFGENIIHKGLSDPSIPDDHMVSYCMIAGELKMKDSINAIQSMLQVRKKNKDLNDVCTQTLNSFKK